MQGKGIVQFFLVVMTIVTLVQYIFILPTQRVEREAEEYATKATQQIQDELQRNSLLKEKRAAFLDSMSSEEVFKIPLLKSYNYQELKAQQLALGLDLKGGMSVVLQVDLRRFIRTLSNDSTDPTFLEAFEKASQEQKLSQTDFVSSFVGHFNEIGKGQKLAPIFQRNESLREEVTFETTNNELAVILRRKADETVGLTFNLLKQRIDRLGVSQPNVSLDNERDLIIVELPGIDNPERARNFLQATATLEFWNVFRINDPGIIEGFSEANRRLATLAGKSTQGEMRLDTTFVTDSLGNILRDQIASIDTTYTEQNVNSGPLFDNFTLNSNGGYGLAPMGVSAKNKRAVVTEMLAREDIIKLFPPNIMFRWSKDPVKDFETGKLTDLYELYALRVERDGKAPLTGDHVTKASSNPDQNNQVAVSLQMDNTGAKIWGQMTTAAAADNNREVAIMLDDEIVSAPRVNQAITSGDSQITGSFTIQEGSDLASILQIGRLPAETQIIQESLVGPSLGKENIRTSMLAMVIGFGIVLLFMMFYYGGAGIVSIITLFLNLFFIFGALASYGTVLTLPGIAGIVLTIGMAVDANVIIFERIREELREGKALLMAITDGFKNSYSAIIDANVTTILTAFVLAYFGLGPIKGFAVVLIIGVLSSLFTAVLVGRLLIDYWVNTKGKSISFSTAGSANLFSNLNIDWMGKRKIAYAVSGSFLVLSIASFFVRGFDLGVDFKGGYSYNITFDQSQTVSADQLRAALTPVFGKTPVVKAVDTDNTYNVVTDYLINEGDDLVDGVKPADAVMAKLYEGVNGLVGGNVNEAQFKAPDGAGTHVTSSTRVGPTIAEDIKSSALYAALFALLLIFLYITLRFSKWQFSAGAVAALFHDSLITMGMFSLLWGIVPFSLEVDQAFIAAILTVIGYSINDTVIIFDRIREFLNTYTKRDKNEVINMAINTTVSRTIITSMTTLFVVFVLFVFGGASIKGFAFAILIGILVGTYSSIFIATPIMSDLSGELTSKKASVEDGDGEKKTFSRASLKS